MAFHPASLPASVQRLFNENIVKHTPGQWPAVVKEAIKQGTRDVNKLTDIIFHLYHPDRIGKPLTPGEANFTKLSEEWKVWKSFAQHSLDQAKFFPPPSPKKRLANLLAAAEFGSGGGFFKQEQRSKLRAFICRGLGGAKLDDAYWTYTYSDVSGEWLYPGVSKKKSMPINLKRLKQKHVLKEFELAASDATTPEEAGKALWKVEEELYENTEIVLQWANVNARTGDANTPQAPEVGYLKELLGASNPNCVYWVYHQKIAVTHWAYFYAPKTIFPDQR